MGLGQWRYGSANRERLGNLFPCLPLSGAPVLRQLVDHEIDHRDLKERSRSAWSHGKSKRTAREASCAWRDLDPRALHPQRGEKPARLDRVGNARGAATGAETAQVWQAKICDRSGTRPFSRELPGTVAPGESEVLRQPRCPGAFASRIAGCGPGVSYGEISLRWSCFPENVGPKPVAAGASRQLVSGPTRVRPDRVPCALSYCSLLRTSAS